MTAALDIIGDVHGQLGLLESLLHRLGYRPRVDSWHHPERRRAVFVGDYLDRGPDSLKVVQLVCAMCESGDALAILGNHDSNAIAFATRRSLRADGSAHYIFDPAGAHRAAIAVIRGECAPEEGWLRDHTETSSSHGSAATDGSSRYRNIKGHRCTLESMSADEYSDTLHWLRRLPLWLELPGLRCIHAAWIPTAQAALSTWARERQLQPMHLECASADAASDALIARIDSDEQVPTDSQWVELLELPGRWGPQAKAPDVSELLPDHLPAVALERILKGVEIRLPQGASIRDGQGDVRHHIRARWFDAAKGRSYHEHMLTSQEQAVKVRTQLGDLTIAPPPQHFFPFEDAEAYPASAPPTFFGHYALPAEGTPPKLAPLRANVACVDLKGDHLLVYRFDGERVLDPGKFTMVSGATTPSSCAH